ncbi:DNA-entry nuclease [Terribacillus sp. JSM ZJ617]|uniref:DNA-entry nuclease n=1 Tax=Terribacillus sp. JSM ZJ617 TaxID=3342119 RepID=UPI0035A9AC61
MEAFDVIEVEYDQFGRMKRHPLYHHNSYNRTPFTQEELEYICKYWHADHMDDLGLALGRTGVSLAQQVSKLKKQGLFDHYKNMNRHW